MKSKPINIGGGTTLKQSFKRGDRVRYLGEIATVQGVGANGALVLLMDGQETEVPPSDVRNYKVRHMSIFRKEDGN
jgi:hypothetical protein